MVSKHLFVPPRHWLFVTFFGLSTCTSKNGAYVESFSAQKVCKWAAMFYTAAPRLCTVLKALRADARAPERGRGRRCFGQIRTEKLRDFAHFVQVVYSEQQWLTR